MSRDKAIFQSTRPMRGATNSSFQRYFFCHYFNPRAPCGARLDVLFLHALTRCDFNPRAPCGARRSIYCPQCGHGTFQSTRPMRGATLVISI